MLRITSFFLTQFIKVEELIFNEVTFKKMGQIICTSIYIYIDGSINFDNDVASYGGKLFETIEIFLHWLSL